ncbi:uncharacterized protein LOC109723411 [Ananas comosus]|uniref:Uncharacterized protein LOC109723411 n=1 Tax=Ananas comosus TaxID=4615 RepID=A0A6P5GHE6_ANACO|nr:uncharacterized protein LOC109723411 [Ananas comosus]XP_020107349.1 uncharacterized protein LOC109723411 [Ananas comosus]
MRPFKKVSKSKQKQSGLADNSPNEASGGIRIDTRTRSQNWSNMLDEQLLGLMRDEHTFGNCVNGSFIPIAWKRMVNDFNSRNNLNLTKAQLKNRFKVLKKTFNLYHSLANKSGWGWNSDLHIPTPGDARIWDSVIAENPAYARCRDKPFPAYDDMEFLTQNTTATGRYAFTSAVELPPIIESSSGSSPDEDDITAGIGMTACNLSSEPFEAGASGCARYSNCDEANTSRSPSPPVMPTTGASGSGHSSGSKRARSPEPSNKQAQTTSTSRGGKKKVDARTSAFLDIAEQGKEKLGWVRQLCQLELRKSTDMPSQNQCMQRVYGMTGLSDDDILVLCDAFKEEKNRNAFMSLNDSHARKWIEREIAQHNLYYSRSSFSGI